jgi:hypothetical protein
VIYELHESNDALRRPAALTPERQSELGGGGEDELTAQGQAREATSKYCNKIRAA